jgi:hypothetical protein
MSKSPPRRSLQPRGHSAAAETSIDLPPLHPLVGYPQLEEILDTWVSPRTPVAVVAAHALRELLDTANRAPSMSDRLNCLQTYAEVFEWAVSRSPDSLVVVVPCFSVVTGGAGRMPPSLRTSVFVV